MSKEGKMGKFNISNIFRRRNVKVTKKPTFFLSFSFMLIFWIICLIYAWLASSSNDIDLLHSLIVMGIVMLTVTFFSFLPAIVYGIFDEFGKGRAEQNTAAELKHHNVAQSREIGEEIKEATVKSYDPRSYRWPVMLTTFTLTIGWVLFFFSEGPKYLYEVMRTGNISYIFSNIGSSHPVVFGFLGAFFWSLGTLFNRYVRGDLKATVFIHITIRIWSVIILTLVISAVWPGYHQFWIPNIGKSSAPQELLAASFLFGIFPDTGLDLLKKGIKGIVNLKGTDEIALNEIQGLSLWDQGRLEEEGIQNTQNLATADVVGLIVNTRLSVMSVLNWVDQALLIIHSPVNYKLLRENDITTATDFEAVYAGRLDEPELKKLREETEQRETYLGCEGITCIPAPGDGMIAALQMKFENGKEAEFDIKERVHSLMTAICDDVSYQRLWKIRHGKPA
jgi:hypothetical protein